MRTVKLGEQIETNGRSGRRVIGIELRIAAQPGGGVRQEEVFMEGLDVELPGGFGYYGQLDWSVTLHTTNGDVTLDTANYNPQRINL